MIKTWFRRDAKNPQVRASLKKGRDKKTHKHLPKCT